jgi:hypothetical protein
MKMSVQTRADQNRDDAIDHIQEAIKNLSDIVIGKCWGHDEFSDEYRQKIRKTLYALIELEEDL